MTRSPKALGVAQEGECLGWEGFRLDPGSRPAPIKNVFPFDAQNLEVSKYGGLRDLLGRARRGIRRIGRRIRGLFTKYQLPQEES